MKRKVIEKVCAVQSYLADVVNEDIYDNQDVQRNFCSKNEFVNGIIMTVLTDDYMPPLILGEITKGNIKERYLIDGMQRTGAMRKFKYEGYKIGKVEDPIITYQVKKKDKNGVIVRDEEGNPVWETAEFNITRKGYDDLPPELKKDFDNFQLKIATYQDCESMRDISALIRKFNLNTSMNTNQKSFTYLDLYARKVKTIAATDFFKESTMLTDKQNEKGLWENMVIRSMTTVFHMDNYKKAAKDMAIFLNTNASDAEFDQFQNIADTFFEVCGDAYKELFIPKNIPSWFAAFSHFLKTKPEGLETFKFKKFLDEFKESLHSKPVDVDIERSKGKRDEIDGDVTWDKLDVLSGTTDPRIVRGKIAVLCKLIDDFYGIEEDIKRELFMEQHENVTESLSDDESSKDDLISTDNNLLKFVQENVRETIDQDDIDLYEDFLGDFIKDESPVYSAGKETVVALMAYATDKEKDNEFSEWLDEKNKENNTYDSDHKKNYETLKEDFDHYCEKADDNKAA